MHLCDLRKEWQLRPEALYYDKDQYRAVTDREDGWLEVPMLPCDVHQPLIAAHIIDEPLVAENFSKCAWIEDRSWWFRKRFTAGPELLTSQTSELVIEGLDVHADLFLNGVYLGHHRSAMYPFRQDVRDVLRHGENLLVVRVTSGLEYYSDLDLSKIKDHISCEYKRGRGPRGDNRRVLVRKPQYVYGWDWTPRIATCGIMGDARIEAYDTLAVRHVKFTTRELTSDHATVRVEVEIENLCAISTLDATVALDVGLDDKQSVSLKKEAFLTSGLNYLVFDLSIADPAPWWPNGMGEQKLYTVTVCARTSGRGADERRCKAGIRTIRLNTDSVSAHSRMFAIEINGIKTFCKGANWVTPDAIYGRVTDQQVETLVREACEANFNMLRLNGVNAYERDYFYDCCDRNGILVWQDFAFSCAAYPDELGWFRHEVEQEIDYHTRSLGNHPCVVLWCGNNECQGHLVAYREQSYWAGAKKPASPGGTLLYNNIMPRIIRRNTPEIPYWNSSAYGGASNMDCEEYGDRHHWIFMSNDLEERIRPEEYDKVAAKFVSEFGCVGPTRKSSLYRYCGSESVAIDTEIWKMHTNTWEKGALKAAIARHYADPQGLSLDEYLLYGGLFQGLMLGYACESMRCADHNYGALLFGFNDAWGEIGWSIIDYYLTRKIAYYFVKRAFQHAKLVMRQKDDVINIVCLNDSPETLQLELEYGYITFDGHKHDTAERTVTVPPFTKSLAVARMRKGARDPLKGVYYAAANNNTALIPAILRTTDFRALQLPRPALSVTDVRKCGDTVSFSVSTDKYVHAVHFGLDDRTRLSDEYFDLLPKESRRVTVISGGVPFAPENIQAGYAGRPVPEPGADGST